MRAGYAAAPVGGAVGASVVAPGTADNSEAAGSGSGVTGGIAPSEPGSGGTGSIGGGKAGTGAIDAGDPAVSGRRCGRRLRRRRCEDGFQRLLRQGLDKRRPFTLDLAESLTVTRQAALHLRPEVASSQSSPFDISRSAIRDLPDESHPRQPSRQTLRFDRSRQGRARSDWSTECRTEVAPRSRRARPTYSPAPLARDEAGEAEDPYGRTRSRMPQR